MAFLILNTLEIDIPSDLLS